MSFIQSKQIYDSTKGATLDVILAALTLGVGPKSLTLQDGTIIKWGTVPAQSSINANTSATVTVAFPVAFPSACEYFQAIVTPASSTDFYGVTSLVSVSTTQVQFTVRNGATAQTTTGGFWLAIGR